ncbi:hypothetical protein [Streptomyces albospinus]|uniref:hypothetical protein n=1 Tax=Streptomyces albospinus TaxID=285515 RepID=UPI0016708A2D|nr:hypothetical protein [Streptomyces albospinus]
MTTTGQSFSFPGLLVIRVRNGQMLHGRDHTDGLGAAHAMGRPTAIAPLLNDRP